MDLGGSYISAALCQAKFFRHGGLVMQIRPDSISSKREFNAKGEISPQCVEAYFDAFDGCRALSPLTYDAHLLHHGKRGKSGGILLPFGHNGLADARVQRGPGGGFSPLGTQSDKTIIKHNKHSLSGNPL